MANTNLTNLFTNIANAIRSKTGKTDLISAQNFPSEITNIQTGYKVGYFQDRPSKNVTTSPNYGARIDISSLNITTVKGYMAVARSCSTDPAIIGWLYAPELEIDYIFYLEDGEITYLTGVSNYLDIDSRDGSNIDYGIVSSSYPLTRAYYQWIVWGV